MAEAKKELRRIEVERSANGGHTVTHHYRDMPAHSAKSGMGMRYVEPEQYSFGPKEGHKMLAHVANHLQVPEEMDEDEAGGGAGQGEE